MLPSAAAQRLVVFEDAAVVHRTPLTAHAHAALQAQRQRPIARLVCYGAAADGSTVGFDHPVSGGGGEERTGTAPPVLTAATTPEVALPSGLRRAVASLSEDQEPAERALAEALEVYVGGGPEVVRRFAAARRAGRRRSVPCRSAAC